MAQTIGQRKVLSSFMQRKRIPPRRILPTEPVSHNQTIPDSSVGITPTNNDIQNDRSEEDAGRGAMVLLAELFFYGWLVVLIGWAVFR